MSEQNLTDRFEANRARLEGVAYRMLGSRAEAEDAVQETWLRLSRADAGAVDNLNAWLTTVTARVCLDMLRARKTRREDALDADTPEPAAEADVEHERMLADSVGLALLVVLDTLAPAERVAFVLHDMFDLSFEQIAPIVGRSEVATRQLASRARRRVQGDAVASDADRARKRQVVTAFFTASRTGDLSALLALLDPNVVLKADAAAVEMSQKAGGAFPIALEIKGQNAVAGTFNGRAAAARVAAIDDDVGAVYAPGGKPAVVFNFTLDDAGRITQIDLIADPAQIATLSVVPLAN